MTEKERFFEQLAMGYPVVDKPIKKRVDKLVEKHRLKAVMGNLGEATPEKPLKLFGNWYYNGKSVINMERKECFDLRQAPHGFITYMTEYPELNVHEFRQAPYGFCDDKYVAVETEDGIKILKTDPKKSKNCTQDTTPPTTFISDTRTMI